MQWLMEMPAVGGPEPPPFARQLTQPKARAGIIRAARRMAHLSPRLTDQPLADRTLLRHRESQNGLLHLNQSTRGCSDRQAGLSCLTACQASRARSDSGMRKTTIAIVTGGDGLEAASSAASAHNVYNRLGDEHFNRVMLAVERWCWTVIRADGIDSDSLTQAWVDRANFRLELPDEVIGFDGAFIALHGAPGETGHLQAWFELLGLPYTGSNLLASATAMDKRACKRVIEAEGLMRVPRDWIIPARDLTAFDPKHIDVSYPVIIKPNAHGSGMGVHLVTNSQALLHCVTQIDIMGQAALVEEYIPGREFTVGAFILNGEIGILPVAEVLRPDYARELTQEGRIGFSDRQSACVCLSPDIDDKTVRQLAEATRAIGIALGCRSFYRVDFILRNDNELFFLEVNTIPGMTERSVFTAQLRAGGMDEGEFYRAVLQEALAGKPRQASRNT